MTRGSEREGRGGGAQDLPPLSLDPATQVTPYDLFRALREARGPLLVDTRAEPRGLSFPAAVPWPGPGWTPPAGRDVVLVDDDGAAALAVARRLRAAGHERVRSLFGGLRLYDHALDPAVVGDERFLGSPGEPEAPP